MLNLSEWLAKSANTFTKSCQTIRNRLGEIINYFEQRTTNGVVEGINNKLKLIKRRVYGFRKLLNFGIRSMLAWHFVC
jgi:transposase